MYAYKAKSLWNNVSSQASFPESLVAIIRLSWEKTLEKMAFTFEITI